ncbi:MAG: hypothetical protein DRQ55_08990 [Planctomycetota bacterium]|nr:MAG: hypothetical protein DRQ55_08990 [Planctomycetota bacterium]
MLDSQLTQRITELELAVTELQERALKADVRRRRAGSLRLVVLLLVVAAYAYMLSQATAGLG